MICAISIFFVCATCALSKLYHAQIGSQDVILNDSENRMIFSSRTNYSPKCNRRNQRHQSKCCKTLHVEHKSIQQQHKNQMSILFQLYFPRPLLQDMKDKKKIVHASNIICTQDLQGRCEFHFQSIPFQLYNIFYTSFSLMEQMKKNKF